MIGYGSSSEEHECLVVLVISALWLCKTKDERLTKIRGKNPLGIMNVHFAKITANLLNIR